jgi:hypothetical protein
MALESEYPTVATAAPIAAVCGDRFAVADAVRVAKP